MNDLNRRGAAMDGSYRQQIDSYKAVQLLIADDPMATPTTTREAVDLF